MNHFYRFLITLLLVFQTIICYCQTISLSNLPNSICSSTPVSITLNTNAVFESTNKLTLQARSEYSGNLYITIPLTQTGNVLTFQFPSSSVVNDGRRYSFRVTSSAPALESEWTNNVPVYIPAEVRLTGTSSAVSNAFEPFVLQFESVGSPPITVTLSDSTRFTLDSYNGLSFNSTVPFYTSSSGTFRLVSAQNSCGLGKVNGQVSLTVNPIALRTLSASPATVCRGGTLSVSYSKTNGNFGSSNRFKIRLTEAYRFSDIQPVKPVIYTLDAKEENGVLRVVIPDAGTGEQLNSTFYSVEVLTTDPVVVGYANKVYVELRPRASVEITMPSKTITYGEYIFLSLKFQGVEPYQATLSDGTTVYGMNSSKTEYALKPKKNTTYRIERFQSACSTNDIPATSAVVVVKPGIVLDSILSTKSLFCEGQTVRVQFSTNATLGNDTRFSMILNRHNSSWVSSPITARREADNILAFEIPTLEPSTSNDARSFSLSLQTASPALLSLPNSALSLQISSKPTYARFGTNSGNTTLETPNVVSLFIDTNGGGPYKLIVNDGQRDEDMSYSGWSTMTTTVLKTTTYTLRSISNSCGTLENPGTSQTVTVKSPAPAQIYLKPISDYRCETDSLMATFETYGDFMAGNVFRVQVSESSSTFAYNWSDIKVVGQGSQSPVRFKVPNSSKIRIVSTNPVVVSNERPAPTGYQLRAVIPSYSPYDVPEANGTLFRSILPGETVTLPIEVNSPRSTGPYSLTYTDGARNYVYSHDSWQASQAGLKPLQTTTYRLVGITNVCGPGLIEGKATFTVVPFRIKTIVPREYSDGQYYSYSVCGTGSISLPFVTDVAPPVGTTFALQISSKKDSVFRELATGTSSPLTARFPVNLEPGYYWMRIVAKGTEARTEPFLLKVQQPPGATLRPPANEAPISAGESFRPTLSLTGTGPWNVYFSDNSTRLYYSSPVTLDFLPQKATTYSIKAVTNACGYGSVSGEVNVRVNPAVFIERIQSNSAEDCAGGTITVAYRSAGDFGSNNKLTIELTNDQGTVLRTLAQPTGNSGQLRINLPKDLSSGIYKIALRASNPNLITSSSIILSVKTPPVVTLAGSTTINPGQPVYLSLRNAVSTNTYLNEQVTYQLSDGTTGQLTLSGSEPAVFRVIPSQTTTYTVSTVSGACGVGISRGSATITVNSSQERSVNTGLMERLRYCTGETVSVPFSIAGSFSTTNQFQVQLLDSTGRLRSSLPSSTTATPLRVVLPNDIPSGGGYRLRVVATDPNTNSGASPYPIQIYQRVTAAFDSAVLVRQPGQPIVLTIRFNGPGPWNYTIKSDIGGLFSGSGTTNPLRIFPPLEGNLYTLVGVGNFVCGTGVVTNPANLRVELLTATEPTLAVSVWPNPTSDHVQVDLSAVPGTAVLQLTDLNGKTLLTKRVKTTTTFLSLASYPIGTYLLLIEVDKRRSIYRLVRN